MKQVFLFVWECVKELYEDSLPWIGAIVITLIMVLILGTAVSSAEAKGHHWCGDNIDNPPKHGHKKSIRKADVVWEQGYPAGEIWKHRCTRAEYIAKWGPKVIETYKTQEGDIVRGIWTLNCCAHKEDKKYPHWSWWREQ